MNININQLAGICLTPELKNGIQILSMSRDDLEDTIIKTYDSNVLIEYSSMKSTPSSSSDVDIDFLLNTDSPKSIQLAVREQISQLNIPCLLKDEAISLSFYILDNGLLDLDIDGFSDESIQVIQSLEPSGVGGRDLRETLLIQANDLGWDLESTIIDIHLNDVATNSTELIAKSIGADINSVLLAIANIKTLNPHPGYKYSTDSIIIPDGYINISKSGFEIGIYDNYTNISIIKNHKDVISKNPSLKSDLVVAKNLINSIKFRNDSLLSLLSVISEIQADYFSGNQLSLVPMTMSSVADLCGVHESTVSRLCSSKSIQTTFGIINLRDFFTNGLPTGLNNISSSSVKNIIKKEISLEIPTNPISDMNLTLSLNDKGIEISRRTVAKYRMSMDIPNSSKRKLFLN